MLVPYDVVRERGVHVRDCDRRIQPLLLVQRDESRPSPALRGLVLEVLLEAVCVAEQLVRLVVNDDAGHGPGAHWVLDEQAILVP